MSDIKEIRQSIYDKAYLDYFKGIDIQVTNGCPQDTIFLTQKRRPSETDEEHAKRCGVITNVQLPRL